MEYKKFGNTICLRLDRDDEILTSIKEVTKKENIKLAKVSGIGAVDFCEVGIFDTKKDTYDSFVFEGTHEITNLCGNINTMNNETYLHIHITLGEKGGNAKSGHLLKGIISVTGEIFIDIIDGNIDRVHDDKINLNKWKFN